ncbi:hypothetical protein GE09DRAFT_1064011 [Coniochaeta sp. 2T2.1]|nr:hypothetical protein GE09DRAFT_1064011 [Coniochaeta sp. 2T2.1]
MSKGLEPRHTYTRSTDSYDETLLDSYYPEKVRTQSKAESQKNLPNMDAPALPQRSALRASRMFDMDTKFQASVQSTELSQATPHDIYLSSEEDASSSADEFEFSDYDFESENEDPQSPRRISHEDTARVVSVVFAGKPSLIDLPATRRSVSPTSTAEARRRASTVSSISPSLHRSVTESAASSIQQHQSPRKSSLVSSLLSRKKAPPFLNIDPYANGSTYSLDAVSKQEVEDESPLKTPKTPTAMLKNGMSRTLSLVRKRSRPLLNTNITTETAPEHPGNEHTESPAPAPAPPARTQTEPLTNTTRMSSLPSPAVTYQDIIKAAKKNSFMAPLAQPSPASESHHEQSPITPTTARRGILSGLAAKRKSAKFTGRVI